MSGTNSPRGALLLGSIPLANAEEVFRTSCDRLGDRLRRVPDGETGERLGWIRWQHRSPSDHRKVRRHPLAFAPDG
jgi:hypothetical protein